MSEIIKTDVYSVRIINNVDKHLEDRLQQKVKDVDGTIILDLGCLKAFQYMAAAGSENPLKEDEKNEYILIQYHGEGTMGGGGEEQ